MPQQSMHLRLVDGDGSDADRLDPIAVLEADHELELRLCDLLEAVADGLPHEVDTERARLVANVLRGGLAAHIELEEQVLFPKLRARNAEDSVFLTMIRQLESEHEGDDAFAIEIADELERLADARKPRNAEMLGYMLRGFFTAKRRHVYWENVTVLPSARRTLTELDIGELRDAVIERQRTGGLQLLELVCEFDRETG